MTDQLHLAPLTRPVWTPVQIISGGTGVVSTKASLRAFYANGTQDYFKGEITLERWSGNPTRYRIAYDGIDSHTHEAEVGTVDLPRSAWNPDVNKGRSENMTGRVLILKFNSNDTRLGLEKVQLTIPTNRGGHRSSKTIMQAFVAADIELQSGTNLIGRNV